MRIKKLVVAASLCCSVGASFALSGSFTLNPTTGVGSFSNFITTANFSDSWSFALGSYAVGVKGAAFSFAFDNTTNLSFNSIALSGGSLASPQAFTFDSGLSAFVLSVPSLSPGNYTISLAGTRSGGGTAGYVGTLGVIAVPEPTGLAASLAGFGVFAALRARRQLKEDATV